MKILAAFAGGLLAALLLAAPAQAQNARSFVSGHGLDTNACTLSAPCRTFAAALALTNAGGEITVLDPAGYGPVTIDKTISIVNDGVGTAGVIVPSGGNGITINAGSNDAVMLRGLSIDGAGVGTSGIAFNSGKSLTVVSCVIRHFTGDGISFFPTASSNLAVTNTLTADNGGDGAFIHPTGNGVVAAVFNHIKANNNSGDGIALVGSDSTGTINATVSDSVAAGNSSIGFVAATAPSHAPTTLMVFHSVAADNGFGLYTIGAAATLRVAHTVVTGNGTGWIVLSGAVLSYGDNYIDGNNGGETAPPSTAQK